MVMYYNRASTTALQIRADASNIRPGVNPAFTVADFLGFYPQFGETSGVTPVEIVPEAVIQVFIDMAQETVMEVRYHKSWKLAISLFVAHFCTLYLQTLADPDSGAAAVFEAGAMRGIVSSESASDVSVSYDMSSIAGDLNGWAAWKMTAFGVQFATLARMAGKGGMVV